MKAVMALLIVLVLLGVVVAGSAMPEYMEVGSSLNEERRARHYGYYDHYDYGYYPYAYYGYPYGGYYGYPYYY